LAAQDHDKVVQCLGSFGPGSLIGREGILMEWEMFKSIANRFMPREAIMKTAPLGTGFGWHY
jgi:hypothetical protein